MVASGKWRVAALAALVGATFAAGWLVLLSPADDASPKADVRTRAIEAPPLTEEAARLARSALAVFRYAPRERR
jgi:hypothetical protein